MATKKIVLKEDAQDKLMEAMQTAFCDEDLDQETRDEMSKQMARVENFFGYRKYTWMRGV